MKIMNEQEGAQQITDSDVRLWKLNYRYDREDLVKLVGDDVKEAVQASASNEQAAAPSGDVVMEISEDDPASDGPEEEENTGVEFPGNSLESMLSFKMDDVEISSRDILAVELRDPQMRQFMFKYKVVKILKHGKCEYCFAHKALTV